MSNLSRANKTVTSDAIKPVAFRLFVRSWRLIPVLLKRPMILFQAVAIIAVFSFSVRRGFSYLHSAPYPPQVHSVLPECSFYHFY